MTAGRPEPSILTYESGLTGSATFNRDANGDLRVRRPDSRENATSFLMLMISAFAALFAGLLATCLWLAGQPSDARHCAVAALMALTVGMASLIVKKHAVPKYDVIVVTDSGVRFEQWGRQLEREAMLEWPSAAVVVPSDLLFRAIGFGIEPRRILVVWNASAESRDEVIKQIRRELQDRRPALEEAAYAESPE
jgi:hypothetical protein